MSTDEQQSDEAPRYTVRMQGVFSPGHDINGVLRMVRDSLKSGIIPVISIDPPEEK